MSRDHHGLHTRLRTLGPGFGVMLPRGLDRPRYAPVGIRRTIVQVERQDFRTVTDDHLITQHDRVIDQQPLGGHGRHSQTATSPRPERRLAGHPRLVKLDTPLSRTHINRSGNDLRAGERTRERRPSAVDLGWRSQMIRAQRFGKDLRIRALAPRREPAPPG